MYIALLKLGHANGNIIIPIKYIYTDRTTSTHKLNF